MTVRERPESIETMSTTTDAIEVIDHLQTDGISRETAKELIDYVDKQRGDLATKQNLKEMATKQDLRLATQDLRAEIEPLKRDVNWIKWIVGIGLTAIPVVLLTVMIYLHNDTKGEIKELKTDIKEIKELLQRR